MLAKRLIATIGSSSRQCYRSMGTVIVKTYGQPDNVLEFSKEKVASENPLEGFLRVSIKASQVTHEDIRAIRGLSSINPLKGVAGTSGLGVIDAVGSNVSGFSTGDTVLVVHPGAWTDSVSVPAASSIKVSSPPSDEAALLPSYLSAWAILHNFQSLKAGDAILLTNGTDPIGQAIVQVGKALDINVVAVPSKDIATPAFQEKVSKLGAIKLAVTTVPNAARNLAKHVAEHGSVVYYNGSISPVLSGDSLTISVSHSIFEDKKLHGFDFTGWVKYSPEKVRAATEQVSAIIKDKKLSLSPKVFKQADYQQAIKSVQEAEAVVIIKV